MSNSNRTNPLVSVIVITYNHGPYIEECLESLAIQACDFPFEILVGEDCSTDDTRQRVLKLAEKYPNLIRPVLSERNLGARSNSRNLTCLAVGKYIALCEGDDYWHRTDKLQRQVEILESDSGIALVCTDADAYFQNTGRRIHSIHERNGQWSNPPDNMTLALLTRKINIFTCTVCMPKNLRLRIWEENTHEFSEVYPMGDIQLWLELSRLGKIVPIRESCATYRVTSESASRSANTNRIFNFHLCALKLSEHYVQKLNYDSSILNEVRTRHLSSMIAVVMKQGNDDLRKSLASEIQARNFNSNEWLWKFLSWISLGDIRFKLISPIYPAIHKGYYLPNRFISYFKRLVIKFIK